MANWAKLQEDTIGLPVYKRAKHGIHFDKGNGEVLANFVGKPCHYQDGGLWKPIDTKLLLLPDGFYGCPHSPVRIHKDGHVKVDGTDYQQYTELPSATGLVDNDRIVRTFSFGEQRMWVTEDGYHSEIQLNRIPTLAEARKVITSESGTLSKKYLKSLTTATDANGAVHTVTTLSAFRTWLASAVFPVVIDPDFAGTSNSRYYSAGGTDWATARSTCTWDQGIASFTYIGTSFSSPDYSIARSIFAFDTSSIEETDTVTQVNLKLAVISDNSGTDFDVQITKHDYAGVRATDWGRLVTGDLEDNIWCNTNGIAMDTLIASGNLSTAWINKAGTTYYGTISKRDRDDISPSGLEKITIYGVTNSSTGVRPKLTITYLASGTLLKVNMNAQMQNLTGGMRG